MLMFDNFESFLDTLVKPASPDYEAAWREFDKRYRSFIIGKLHRMTRDNELVRDIVGEFSMKLLDNSFRAIKAFKLRDNETAFRAYLWIIARSIALKLLPGPAQVQAADESIAAPDAPPDLAKIYGEAVNVVRAALEQTVKKKTYEIERDILVCMLRKMARFSAKEVGELSLLKLNPGSVDNIVFRVKGYLEKNIDDVRDNGGLSSLNGGREGSETSRLKEGSNDHLRVAQILATAVHGEPSISAMAWYDHLTACAACQKTVLGVRQIVSETPDSATVLPCECPGSLEQTATFVAHFLRSGVNSEQLTPFLRQINGCYPCFEILMVNWSQYLEIKKELDSDEGDLL